MFPKLQIESGSLKITGECIEKIPFEYGVKWKEQEKFDVGNLYKFNLDVNGEKGVITLSDQVLNVLSNSSFNELLISDLTFDTSLPEFRLILHDVYKNWIEITQISPL